jgi:hypothetical protein
MDVPVGGQADGESEKGFMDVVTSSPADTQAGLLGDRGSDPATAGILAAVAAVAAVAHPIS